MYNYKLIEEVLNKINSIEIVDSYNLKQYETGNYIESRMHDSTSEEFFFMPLWRHSLQYKNICKTSYCIAGWTCKVANINVRDEDIEYKASILLNFPYKETEFLFKKIAIFNINGIISEYYVISLLEKMLEKKNKSMFSIIRTNENLFNCLNDELKEYVTTN